MLLYFFFMNLVDALIMVIELSGVQFGLKSNARLQNRMTALWECDL
jgi:hypothetical protein